MLAVWSVVVEFLVYFREHLGRDCHASGEQVLGFAYGIGVCRVFLGVSRVLVDVHVGYFWRCVFSGVRVRIDLERHVPRLQNWFCERLGRFVDQIR